VKVEQIMTKDVRSCRRSASLNEAAQVMWERDCGFVPVIEDDGTGTLVGVITDRDICMAAYTQGKRLSEIGLAGVMRRAVQTCRSDDELGRAEATMCGARVRRLPVVDLSNHVVGVISLSDIARAAGRTARAGRVSQREVGEALAGISEPRHIEGPAIV
jgi:CBS domain-containing protein